MRMTVSPLLTKGATLDYRKIQGLEHDPVIMGNYLQSDLFKDVASRTYPGGAVGIYRTMFFNKSPNLPGGGSPLGWHQDRVSSQAFCRCL
jgi:hypothetical protein